jgi:hypothetical protein
LTSDLFFRYRFFPAICFKQKKISEAGKTFAFPLARLLTAAHREGPDPEGYFVPCCKQKAGRCLHNDRPFIGIMLRKQKAGRLVLLIAGILV